MAVETITVGAGQLTIGAVSDLTNFSSQTTSVKLVPSVDQGDSIAVLSGESVAGDRTESFNLEGTILQDLGATESKTEWLFEHRGETHAFEFVPSTAKGKKITGSLVVEAVEIGGDVGTKPTSDFEFLVVGEPVLGDVI
ncbi:hypothetical protein ACT3UD_18395 [Glutamicibacter sp. 287]|uniref:hypothetical protein n=1 Tax=unclassified Glutamicibacter TaxID=2627139 RepID=UPI000BB985EA|nr:hypothetical protein [Glutamicibacter sp. BW80]PCC29795.1 hypothetical protein CIK76_05225 [Glutamicibacter sp. BW80]